MPFILYDFSKASELGVKDLPQVDLIELGFDSIEYTAFENHAFVEVFEMIEEFPEYIKQVK